MLQPPRTKIIGLDAIYAAIDAGLPVQLVLVLRDGDAAHQALARHAEARGIQLWNGGEGDLRRMSPDSEHPATALALVGDPPSATLPELLARGGACWLLNEPAYPSNVGFIIRTAEVSGAAGVIIDAPDFNREQRSRASHVCMGADRVMPVLWNSTSTVLAEAQRQQIRTVAIEDTGSHGPADLDLTGPLILIVGNERSGIPPAVRAACSAVLRIPMLGFVPSYSVQAAVATVAWERLRQLQATASCTT